MRNLGILALLALFGTGAWAQDWVERSTETYGIRCLLPADATIETQEWDEGWAGIKAVSAGGRVTMWGLTKSGAELGPTIHEWQIRSRLSRITGIEERRLDERFELMPDINDGRDHGQVTTYKCRRCFVVGTDKAYHLFTGNGPGGAYAVLLENPIGYAKKNPEKFVTWFNSINIFTPTP